MSDIKFIPPGVSDQLIAQADLLNIIQHWHLELKKSGSSYRGNCPNCQSDRFTVTPAKGIIKCFKCDLGADDIISYLIKFRGMKYVEACVWLAGHLNFDIPVAELSSPTTSSSPVAATPRTIHDTSFRDEQLRSSGITDAAQQILITVGDKETIINRYSAGSVDSKFMPTAGHDMLLHYYDLDGQPIKYTPKGGKSEKPYIRVRHKYPSAHPDNSGKPVKYLSPPGSKNHLWMPETIRRKFIAKDHIDTLVFVEGEKKADALCMAGIDAVGIAGIFNLAGDTEMPTHIERLITGCSIDNVVFWLDSDLFSLGSDLTKDTDARPRLFAGATLKFRAYFQRFMRDHVNIQTWLCYGTDTTTKGADDLLISLSPDLTPEHPLSTDFADALRSHTSEGKYVRVHLITPMSDTAIKELWHLHAPRAFMEHHKEFLKTLPEFRYEKHRYAWDESAGSFTSNQKLLKGEQYWYHQDTKFGPLLKFDYLNITIFLRRCGFWRQRMGLNKYRLIRVQDNIVTEIDPDVVQEFVYDFTLKIEELQVLRMLMQGGTAYFGADKLKNLSFYVPPFVSPVRGEQILVFRNDTFWRITAKEITVHKHSELPGAVWKQDIIDITPTNTKEFTPSYIPDFITISEDKNSNIPYLVEFKVDDSDICNFIARTSDIHWRDARKTKTGFPEGADQLEDKDLVRINTLMTCMIDKILATGYCVSDFMDPATMRAIVCMDAHESKGGKSEGGTGKSLWAYQFKYLFPVHNINGKQARLSEDNFLYDGVDERTRMIKVDDCRRTTDFESFFSFITGGLTVNSKGVSKNFVGYVRWIFTTNFSIRGEDRSHLRRQFNIAFGDYFNQERDPISEFGHALFDEWDDKQWNYWCNWIASALQFHMRLGLKAYAPDADIRRRRLRDMITEVWLDFFETYFYTGSDYINRRFDIDKLLEVFLRKNPSQKNFPVKTIFKERIDWYCKYAGFQYNKPKNGERIRNGSKGIEYFVISDHEFDLEAYEADINRSLFDSTNLPDF